MLTVTLEAVIAVLSLSAMPPVTAYWIAVPKVTAPKTATNPAPAVFPGHIKFMVALVVPRVTLEALNNFTYTGVARILKHDTLTTVPALAFTLVAAGVAGATAEVTLVEVNGT
jgi:hypothetical protein